MQSLFRYTSKEEFQRPILFSETWISASSLPSIQTTWKNNLITIKSKTLRHVAEQSSWVPLPSYSPPGHFFPIKSLALLSCVSPQTMHFQVLDKSPFLGSGRDPTYHNRKMNVHSSLIHSILNTGATQMSITRRMGNQSEVYLLNR